MKDKSIFGFTESVLDAKFIERIKLIFKIVYFGSYFFCFYYLINFYFFTNRTATTSNGACANGFSILFYPFFVIFIPAFYLLCTSHFSQNAKHKNLYYKLIIIPAIILAISSYLYITR